MPTLYPLPVFHFTVQWGGTRIGFSEVSGLTQENQAIEYRDGDFKEYSSHQDAGSPQIQQHHNETRNREKRQRVLQLAQPR